MCSLIVLACTPIRDCIGEVNCTSSTDSLCLAESGGSECAVGLFKVGSVCVGVYSSKTF